MTWAPGSPRGRPRRLSGGGRGHPPRHARAGVLLGRGRPGAERSPAEEKFAAEVTAWTAAEGGYAHEQSTKPATLGAALHDSPAGLAAWIGEKVTAWSAAWP